MIRVAYFLEAFDLNGGAERSVFHIIKYIDRKKFEPIMISLGKGGEFEKKFINNNIEYHVINTKGLFHVNGYLILYKLLKNLKIDIIDTNTFNAHIQCRLLVKLFFKNKIVSTYRNQSRILLENGIKDYFKKTIDKFTSRFFSDALIFVSEGTKKFYENHGYRNEKMHVILNSIDIQQIGNINFSDKILTSEFSINENQKIIIAVGRLTKQKGYEYLFPAVNRLCKNDKNVTIIIFGEDQSQGYYTSLLEHYSHIRYVLVDSYPDIYKILCQSDLFISSSLWEGLPRAHLEALLCGCPIISTDIGGSNEVITNDFNGTLVEPKNSDAIFKAINDLLYDNDKKNKYIKNGYNILKNKFDIHKNVKMLENIYLELI